ncbi:SPRY domain protein, partial [Oesophagostomum dentatum]
APEQSSKSSTPAKKRVKRSKVKEEPSSPTPASETETPTARPRKPRRPRAAAGEDVAVPSEVTPQVARELAPEIPKETVPEVHPAAEELSQEVQVKSEPPDEAQESAAESPPTTHARKLSHQKDEEDRHSLKRPGASTSSKSERIPIHKPITEAWAERLAQLKKANPSKFATAGTTPKEKQKNEKQKQPNLSEYHYEFYTGSTSIEPKKSSSGAATVSKGGLDLLDSIMNQQSEFLQTMRRSDDRNSPDIIEVRRVETNDEIVERVTLDKPQDMSATAQEAYKRFEQTCAEAPSEERRVKSSPKSPQILPPPPPPPKPAPQPRAPKKIPPVGVTAAQLLVPPPPPPPPPPQPQSSPARHDGGMVAEVKRETPSPVDNSTPEELAILSDVKACLEYVVFLVSSIKPFDEICGDLLPATEMPIPFSQRTTVRSDSTKAGVPKALAAPSRAVNTPKDVENSAIVEKPQQPQQENAQEDEEEYDPLETSAVEGFENYVPSAVVSRNVTLDELVLSQTPEPEGHAEPQEEERYSPTRAHVASPIDEDEEEEEVLDDIDSDVLSPSDDSEDDSEGDDEEPSAQTYLRQDEMGRILKVIRRRRKKVAAAKSADADASDVAAPSQDQTAEPVPEGEEVDRKPDPSLLNNPRHLLQRASAVLQGLGKKENSQYSQMPYDEEYEEEECVQPMDSFHGEPVPDDDDLFEVAAGIKPKRKEEVVIVEEKVPTSTEEFEIDFYNGDLHLKGAPDNDWIIDPDNQDGLALVWGGVRSTHGIFPSCHRSDEVSGEGGSDENSLKSIVFQVKILDLLPTRHLPFDELDPNDIRVGFSLRSAPLVLGEYPGSYCFTSLGKRANNNIFTDYGDPFTVGDVITAQMDFEKRSISFWKNDESLGEAFTNIVIPEGEAIYPHICVKNCRVSVNFGTFPGGEDEWLKYRKFEGGVFFPDNVVTISRRPEWVFPNALPSSQTERAPVPPESKSDCTVLMMVGLPSVGKTTWVRRYIREHPSEHWTLISSDTILASMKVNGVSRNSSHIGRWDMILGLVGKARNRLLSLAARRRRNYILDFTNCDPDTRKKRLALFEGFFRQCVTIVPSDEVMQQRHARHLRQNRGEGTAAVPIETFLELKAVMEMPVVSEFLESVIYVDPAMEDAQIAIDRIAKFNEEGRPWYSSKYNKKRGYWSGTYGDEPYRKSSSTTTATTTRPQPVSTTGSTAERSSTETSNNAVTITTTVSPVVNTNISSVAAANISPVAATNDATQHHQQQQRRQLVHSLPAQLEAQLNAIVTITTTISPVVNTNISSVVATNISPVAATNDATQQKEPQLITSGPKMREELPTASSVTNSVAALSLQAPTPVVSTANTPTISTPSVITANNLITTVPPPTFNAPLPSVPMQALPAKTAPPPPPVRQVQSAPLSQKGTPIVAQPPPITIIPPPPFHIGAPPVNHSPIAISTYSPRNRWDAPPPVLPNFSVPPPSIPPPSLVMPNLYVPNAIPLQPAILPLLPNTSVPPPNIPPTNVPPPGWPLRRS